MRAFTTGVGIQIFALFAFSFQTLLGQTVDSFNPNANNVVYAAIQQLDGRIILGGSFTNISGQSRSNLARFYPDGSFDSSFVAGVSGAQSPEIRCLALQTNGQILIGGRFATLNGFVSSGVAE